MTRLKLIGALLIAFTAGAVLAPVASYAVSYFSTTRVVTGSGTAACPSGYRVTGGGVYLPTDTFGSNSSREYKIRSSRPNTYGTAWVGQATVISGSYSTSAGWRYTTFGQTASVYAICVR